MDAPKKTRSQRRSSLHDLDIKHQVHVHRTRLATKDEEARRLKLRALLLKNEKSDLQGVVQQKEQRLQSLQSKLATSQEEVERLEAVCQEHTQQLKTQAQEISLLQTEVASHSTRSQESTKLLAEKLALRRELDLLQPEIEHLQSQLTHQQSILSEKRTLERQLEAVQAELEDEKQVNQQLGQKLNRGDKGKHDLQSRLDELDHQLAQERENKDNLRKEHALALAKAQSEAAELRSIQQQQQQEIQQLQRQLQHQKQQQQQQQQQQQPQSNDEEEALRQKVESLRQQLAQQERETKTSVAEVQAEKEALEDRIDGLKSKLRDTREELKRLRAQFDREENTAALADAAASLMPIKSKNKKRTRAVDDSFEEESSSILLHGRGGADAWSKKQLRRQALEAAQTSSHSVLATTSTAAAGPASAYAQEKSTFSITPFLNKTGPAVSTKNREDSLANIVAQELGSPTRPVKQASKKSQPVIGDDGPPVYRKGNAHEDALTKVTDDGAQNQDQRPTKASTKGGVRIKQKSKALADASVNVPGNAKAKIASSFHTLEEEEEGEDGAGQEVDAEEQNSIPELDENAVEDAENAKEQQQNDHDPAPLPNTLKRIRRVKGPAASAHLGAATDREEEPKKRRRKLAGMATKTLFDEMDGGEDIMLTGQPMPTSKKAPLTTMSKRMALKKRGGVGADIFGGGTGSTFSPLKREKRGGVQASFLL